MIHFIKNIENLDYMEAVKLLADRAGLSLPESGYDDSAEKMRRRIYAINRETAKFFHACLLDAKIGLKGRQYFAQRKLTPKTITHFGLGYAPDSWNALCDHLRKMGYSNAELTLANVANNGKNGGVYDRFRNKIMFPIIDVRGNVIAFGGRKFPGEEGAKYINTSDTPVYKKSQNIYALNFAKNDASGTLILCEGYMDVIALHQAGFTNAVAALGTSFTEDQAHILTKYAKEIIVTMDADEAGQKATRRTIDILKKTGVQVRVLQIEGGKDPDEFIKAYGAEKFKALLSGAKNDIEYQLFRLQGKYDITTDAGKLQYLNEAIDVLTAVDSIAENLYAGRLSMELSVDKQVILKQIQRKRALKRKNIEKKQFRALTTPAPVRNAVNREEVQHRRACIAEEKILSVMMLHYDLYQKYSAVLLADDFVTQFNQTLYQNLKDSFYQNEFVLSMLNDRYSPEQISKIVQIQNLETGNPNPEITLKDCINVLKEEKAKLKVFAAEDMSDDDFQSALKSIGKNKIGKDK